MGFYQIDINERTALGRSILRLLKSVPEVTMKKMRLTSKRKPAKEEETIDLYEHLDSAFHDVREIMDGKQKKVTLDELLNEL